MTSVPGRASPDPVRAACPSCGLDHLVSVVFEVDEQGRWVRGAHVEGAERLELDACPICHGAWFDAGELDDLDDEGIAAEAAIADQGRPGRRECPRGHGPMWEHTLPGRLATPVDRCRTCAGIWLDGHERDRLARASNAEARTSTSERWAKRGLLYTMQVLTHLPVEIDNPARTTPWIVLALLLAYAAIYGGSVLGWVDVEALALLSGRLREDSDYGTLLSYQFLHASVLHLFGNGYFLYVFGDNIEYVFGRLRFVAFYLGAGVAGGAFHVLFSQATAAVVVGASGAIAGVLAAYTLVFPRSRLSQVIFLVPIRLPAWVYLIVWVGFHLVMAFFSHDRAVAWFAHLGGVIFGVAITPWLLRLRKRSVATMGIASA